MLTTTKLDSRVQHVSDERRSGEGVWFHLKPGYVFEDEHSIHGDSERECRAKLIYVAPCECAFCKRRR